VTGLAAFWDQADGVGRAVALALLAMSVTAWVLMLWKGWLLRRAAADLERALAAFWDASTLDEGRARLLALDRQHLLAPLLDAAWPALQGSGAAAAGVSGVPAPAGSALAGSLGRSGPAAAQLTRRLRDGLHRGAAQLQWGQVMLASIGSTAPFVGLLGTVWGIYGALAGMAEAGGVRIERVAGPIGEALVMTAAGIAVAVPAVLAYNALGKRAADTEAVLEGFAHDLHALALPAGTAAGDDAAADTGAHAAEPPPGASRLIG
jgi:biopolymer transport protein ExbB